VVAACYRAGNYVCVTGQTAFTLDGKLVGVGDPAVQARQAMDNIKTLMEMAGGSLADVVKLVVYATSYAHRATAQPTIRSYFPGTFPCETSFIIKGLAREELLVEIDAWGFIDDARATKQLVHAHDVTTAGGGSSGGRVAECYWAGNLVALRSQGGRTLDATLMGMAGGTVADVSRTIYAVPERHNRHTAYPVVQGYFRDQLPAGTGLIVNGLTSPDSLIEIDTWGWIDTPEAKKRVIRSRPGAGRDARQHQRPRGAVLSRGQLGLRPGASRLDAGRAGGGGGRSGGAGPPGPWTTSRP
jgi:enamine deaminase RidA (YjgF/YER057c/UK114 family)